MQQAVESERGLVICRRDRANIVRPMLIRDVRIKAQAGSGAVSGIYVAGVSSTFAGSEELPIGR